MPKSFPNNDPMGYYACLGLQPGATAALIRAAYKVRAMELHPDRNPRASATSEFQQLQEAYDVLSTDQKRSAYDALARDRESASSTSSSGYNGAGSSPQTSPKPKQAKAEQPNQEMPYPGQRANTSAFTKMVVLTMLGLVVVVYVNWDYARTSKREAESRQSAEMARVAQADADKAVELERRERLEAKAAAERQRADELAALEKPLPVNGVIEGSRGVSFLLFDQDTMAPFRVTAPPDASFFVKLVEVGNSLEETPAVSMFVRAGRSVELVIPQGAYKIKMAAGTKWYGNVLRFGPDTQYTEVTEPLVFTSDGQRLIGHTINLSLVRDGNMRPVQIEPSSF